MRSFTGVIQDLVENIFGPVLDFEGIGTMVEVFALLGPESFYLGWGNVRRETEVENEEGSDHLFIVKQVNLIAHWNIVFDDEA